MTLSKEEKVEHRRASKQRYDKEHRQEGLFRVQYKEYCKKNRSDRLRALRNRRQKWYDYLKYLNMGHCLICGYSKCQSALEFHHWEPKEKEAKLAQWMCRTMTEERVMQFLEEITKCIRICANCHRELHEAWDTERKV